MKLCLKNKKGWLGLSSLENVKLLFSQVDQIQVYWNLLHNTF